MGDYVIRDGVLMTSILDQYLLVSTKACREKCAYVKRINPTAAFYWELIEQGLNLNQMVDISKEQFNIDDSSALKHDILDYINLLKEAGYLLSDDELSQL